MHDHPGTGSLPLHMLQTPRQPAARPSPNYAIVLHSGIMNTAFLLIAMYSGRPIIPAEDVARDFFGLSTDKFIRKVSAGSIALPLVRMEASQKCAKGVHIDDLAEYLDKRRAAAVKECLQLQGLR
ncbi:hypothetical protein GCM10011324_45920 [Allosediminivita pacifica]|nr:hypothetical protein GCM10011324_45920 [Allosediminivita pacifica]